MPAKAPRCVGLLQFSKAPSSRNASCAACTVPRKRTSISRMHLSNSGNLSSTLPLRKSLTLWTTTSIRSTQHTSALVVDLQRQVPPLDLEHGQIIAPRLHGLDHLDRLASPLCHLVRAM